MPLDTGVRSIVLGVDIGGTFTDIVAYDRETGRSFTYKELTTPAEPSTGVIAGIRALFAEHSLDVGDVKAVIHATTLFTNALIERKGATVGLLTTKGFRDTLEIGREMKYDLYDLFIELPAPLVPRERRHEIAERMAADGTPEIAPSAAEIIEVVSGMVARGVDSLAVMFLHSYINPAHERFAKEVIQERFPELSLSLSSEVAPEIREYERVSTTAANAYIKPIAAAYIQRLRAQLTDLGIHAPLSMMLSSGGLAHIAEAQERPIQLLESGPAAGALSAAYYGTESGANSVLAFDMGGTTAKLCVVDEGVPLITRRFEAARQRRFAEGSGLPINISTIDLIEIGAGGGSIATLDNLGLLKVGPESAASVPGPACYNLGGKLPTVTDANLILGYLAADSFAGGKIPISVEAAQDALRELSAASGLDRAELAFGIHNIVNERMANAARVHLAERGKNILNYSLLTTGGGGPLHGCAVAQKLGISRVICPRGAGVASAIGLLMAPPRIDRVRTIDLPLAALDWDALERLFAEMEAEAAEMVLRATSEDMSIQFERTADLRCRGQGFEVLTDLPAGPYTREQEAEFVRRFQKKYKEIYYRSPPGTPVELVNIRVAATARAGERSRLHHVHDGAARRVRERPAYFGGLGYVDTPVIGRSQLEPGETIIGPAIVEEPESTLIIPPHAMATVDKNGTIIVELNAASQQLGVRAA